MNGKGINIRSCLAQMFDRLLGEGGDIASSGGNAPAPPTAPPSAAVAHEAGLDQGTIVPFNLGQSLCIDGVHCAWGSFGPLASIEDGLPRYDL